MGKREAVERMGENERENETEMGGEQRGASAALL